MKHMIMAAVFVPACFVLACGTKKDEKKMPVTVVDQSSDSTVPTSADSLKKCDSDDVSQNQSCLPAVPVGELRILQESSWSNPKFYSDGRLQDDDGACLEKFKAGARNENSIASLDMSLQNMNLKDDVARCLVQIRVAYTKGYAFAIRRVAVPLMTEIPEDSLAVFEGSFGIKGKNPVLMERNLESRYSDKPLRLDHSVADQDIVWSSCSGQALLRLDTKLSMDFRRSGQTGDIRIEGKSPYRMEIVWAKCQ
jgi:hypothetical protein